MISKKRLQYKYKMKLKNDIKILSQKKTVTKAGVRTEKTKY